ncbi:glucan endo-1,3-beta-glucosidase 7 [Populus alba]
MKTKNVVVLFCRLKIDVGSSAFIFAAFCADSQSFIGINYGQLEDNLPPPSSTAKLLQSTSIQKVRLYGSDPAIIKALANTGIPIIIGTANGDIPGLASDPNFAKSWINTNVLPFYPARNIILITVGNEIMTSNDQNLMNKLLPAMQNVQNALNDASLGGKIKVSTVHSIGVLKQSEPPSSGSFDPSYGDLMKGLLEFNSATGSPFAINPYPYFAYRSDTRPETLAFCLFQPNAGRMDGNTKIKYMNMFDAQVDAVYSALNSMGFKNVEIVVAETGWPFKGDDNDVGPSIENAKAYNGNLIAHLRSMVGTPLMPGKSVDTFLFALYDGDLKPGPGSQRSFGLFKTDLTMVYDVGLSTSSQTRSLAAAQQLLAATPQPLQAVATNTSTGTNNNNSSTSTSTSTSTGTSTSTSSSTNNITIRNGGSSGSSSNKVHLNRIFNLGLLYGFMGLSLICLFFFVLFGYPHTLSKE